MEYKEVGKNGQNSSGSEHVMHTDRESLGSIKGPEGGGFLYWVRSCWLLRSSSSPWN